MENIFLFGASYHGKVIKEICDDQKIQIEAFIDDSPKDKFLLDIPIISLEKFKGSINTKTLISIGNNNTRKKISEKFKFKYISIVHSKATISDSVKIDVGTTVMAGAIINVDTKIGKHGIINTGAVIEHDCKIGDFVHISPNATVTGNVSIGEGTHLGAGATVIPNIKIGKWVTIGAGAVIIKDIPDYAVVVGNPGKIIKYNY